MAVRRVISMFGGALTNNTLYTSVIAPGVWANQATAEVKWAAPTYFRQLRIVLDTAPGVGKSRTFNILVNGVAVATMTISGLSTEGTIGDDSAFAPLDAMVCLEHIPSGTPAACNIIDYGVLVDSVESNISLYGGCLGAMLTQSMTSHFLFPGGFYGTVLGYILDVLPCSFTAKRWVINLSQAPGAGEFRTFTVRASPPLEGNPFVDEFAITISDDEVEGEVSPDVTWPAGTLIQVIHTCSAGADSGGASWCVRGRISGEDGKSIMGTTGDPVVKHDGTGWYSPNGNGPQVVAEANSATEVRGAFSFIASYVKQFDGTPDGTQLFFTTRRNVADTPLVVNLAGPNLDGEYGFIEGVEEAFEVGDSLNMQVSNGGSPVSSGHVGQWSWLMSALADEEPGTIGPLLWVELSRVQP